MRMGGLLRRLNKSGQRTEALLKAATRKSEPAESAVQEMLIRQGFLCQPAGDDGPNVNPE